MRLHGGFSLLEVLTSVATFAVLGSIMMPAVKAAKGAGSRYFAIEGVRRVSGAALIYAADNDETFPLGIYREEGGYKCWFGLRKDDGTVDTTQGILENYCKQTKYKDPTFIGKPYFGDATGYGYNYSTLGSDLASGGGSNGIVDSANPAKISGVQEPKKMIMFATSAYLFPTWAGGNNQTYDFGFISPPSSWLGNPTIDFRHGGEKVIDADRRTVSSNGKCIAVTVDLAAHVWRQEEVSDANFLRGLPQSE